jgi:hypothetical protein
MGLPAPDEAAKLAAVIARSASDEAIQSFSRGTGRPDDLTKLAASTSLRRISKKDVDGRDKPGHDGAVVA